MVNLILQPIFLNLVKGSSDNKMTSDDLYNMWSVASRAKSAIVQGRRLENLSWRLWYTSTIRIKHEIEEKRRKLILTEIASLDEHVDGDDVYDNQYDSSSSGLERRRKQSRDAIVLPSDRPLFASTCASILAEIQDASFRFSTNPFGLDNFTNQNNRNSNHLHPSIHSIISPPTVTLRSKSPANNHLHNGNQQHPKRKKDVERFLKKFKSNLEDITEQFDDKFCFTDDEPSTNDINKEEDDDNNNVIVNVEDEGSLSPTASSNHFATDEEGQNSSFYTRNDDLICLKSPEKGENHNSTIKTKTKTKVIGMITKLLKAETESGHSPTISNLSNLSNLSNFSHQLCQLSTKVKPEPNYPTNSDSDSFINNQLELMANRGYNRIGGGGGEGFKSPRPVIEGDLCNRIGKDIAPPPVRRVIDANALSTSLSASKSKFCLEDEFDSQIVIW